VVVGAGFGGLAAASYLAGRTGVDLTVIDRHDHHLFQPLLYQVATAALSPSDIAAAVRGILPAGPDVRVLMASVTGIDTAGRLVLCEGMAIPYDELILATGSQPSYFGHESWAGAAPSLKTLDDALSLRRRILQAFEQALLASGAEQSRLLTFVLIGGGPTGVEMAGSIAELARDLLRRSHGGLAARARIILVEAGPRVLSAFAPDLSIYTVQTLQRMGVEVREGTKVIEISPGEVQLDGETIAAATIVWTAGTEATPVAEWLGVTPAKGGRVNVGPDMRLAGHAEIAVIGDAALVTGPDGASLPGLAPVAKQQGRFVARSILRILRGKSRLRCFAYWDYGTLATIGRNQAVAELGSLHLKGVAAWLMWAMAHIFFLIGFRNRIMVLAQWAFAYATDKRPGQLIIGGQPSWKRSVQ
jgi:NADH dehydrogenase